MRLNPVLREALHGIAGAGTAHGDWLLYLFVQAVAVFIWWPKDSLPEALQATHTPQTLLAAVLAVGATVSWYAARAGAEELLLPGQSGLADWAAATRLPLGRILAGYLAGHLVQTAGLVALSLPLVLCGFSVSGGEWAPLAWCLMAVVFQATGFRLSAAAIYLAMGQHGAMTLLSIRAVVIVTYLLTAVLAPAASHLVLSSRLLGDGATAAAPHPVTFIALFAGASAVLLAVVHRQLRRVRRAAPAGAAPA